MTNAALRGKPDAGNPHVRFDEGEVALAATPRRGSLLYTNAALRGKPDAGNPHVRFDEGEVASAATPRRGSLLYNQSDNMVKAVQAQSNAATRRWFCLGLASGAAAFGLGCVGSRRSACENAAVRAAVRKYVEDGLYAGLACASSRGDMYLEGSLRIGGPKLPVTDESLFDLASVGKTQTAALCALLYADGRLDVDAPFTEYIPEHVLAKENCRITVRDLATHSGGFDNSKPYMVADPVRMFEELYRKRPVWPRGDRFCYACSNFVYLGLIVERLTGLDLDAAARKMLWGPLGMSHTTWNTIVGNPNAVEFLVPSKDKVPVNCGIGNHNDECARLAPRPMGNGANFSTAPDMLKFVTDMLRRERFPKAYYDLQFAPSFDKGGYRRSFGWEMTAEKSSYSIWTKTGFSSRAICHSGWTGPAIAVDPKCDFAGVVLGNRIASKEKTMGPRMKILDMMRTAAVAVVACAALACRAAFAETPDRSLMGDAYWEIWNDAEQARIDADIEANRKADGAFEVDALDGAAVRVEQIDHAFRFGAHIFNFNQLGKTEYNDAYKASYGKGGLFNLATVAFYWVDYEPEPGKLRAQGNEGSEHIDTGTPSKARQN